MAWTIERSPTAEADLEAIFDFLFETYQSFGEDAGVAFSRAADRVRAIEDAIARLAEAPRQGTQLSHIAPGLRQVTKDRAAFYFNLDEATQTVRVFGVFFGGQDHRRRMLRRLMGGG